MAASEGQVTLAERAQPWGPQAYRRELLDAIEATALELLRLASASAKARTEGALPPKAVRLVSKLQPLLGKADGKPGQAAKAAKALRLRRWLALLDSVHGLLVSGRHATPRELFYSHVGLFTRQHQSDDVLKSFCHALQVPRHYFHLVGTAKGLVRGHLRILEPCLARGAPGGSEDGGTDLGCWVDGMDPLEPRGHAISPICAHLVRVEAAARTVLVVEKETVFHRLLSEGLLERQRPCIVLTARGFPDVPTRYFLRRVYEDLGAPRILVLTDFDASGLAIGMTYAFGAEDAWVQDDLALPDIEPLVCLGPAGAARYGLRAADTTPLTHRDRSMAGNLLRRLERVGGHSVAEWQKAAALLLAGGVKYELDALDQLSEFVDAGMREEGWSAGDAGAARALGVA